MGVVDVRPNGSTQNKGNDGPEVDGDKNDWDVIGLLDDVGIGFGVDWVNTSHSKIIKCNYIVITI